MAVPYTPLAIANEFIANFGSPTGIEHMKLQKLVYCAYGWWLASHEDETRLTDEGPEIWKHGPVFSSLYSTLRIFGREPITHPQSRNPFEDPPKVGDDREVVRLLQWVWSRYGHLSSFALSDMTHKPGTPWHRVAQENSWKVPFNTRIPDEYIREEFRSLMRDSIANVEVAGDLNGRQEYA